MKNLSMKYEEEKDIKAILGIPPNKIQIREVNSLGGGGNQNIRKELTLGRLRDNRIPAGTRLKLLKNQQMLLGKGAYGLKNNPYESLNTTQTVDEHDYSRGNRGHGISSDKSRV